MSGSEAVFFVYSCSQNNGLETLVSPDSENLQYYEEQDCESLDRIVWWTEDTTTSRPTSED